MHRIHLTASEQRRCHDVLTKGRHNARVLKRAQIILNLYDGMDDKRAAKIVRMCTKTMQRIRARFDEGGLDRALYDAPRSGQPKKTTADEDAYIIATACTEAPEGRRYWTLDLLKEQIAKKQRIILSRNALHVRLSERKIKPWREKNVVHSEGHTGVR